jgi:glycosyltransferase involved in cell wall biosynthesis
VSTPTTVAVVIPVRDGRRYLGEAIASALSQHEEGLEVEVIVVDDGSRDDSAKVAEAAGAAQVISTAPRGLGAARNSGTSATEATLLAFLDADDRFSPGRLAAQAEVLENDPELFGVAGHMCSFLTPERAPELAERFECPPQTPCWMPTALLIRRERLLLAGDFDEQLEGGEGVDWVLRAREAGLRIEMLDRVVLERRIHGENMTIVSPRVSSGYLQVARAAVLRRREREGAE